MPTPQEILARTGGDTPNISEFVGKTLTLASVTWNTGQHGDYVTVDAVDEEGEEFVFQTGAKAVVGKLKHLDKADALPIEVKVTSYPTSFGKNGYDIRPTEEEA